jgi:3-oxoadipate enol-lactonase
MPFIQLPDLNVHYEQAGRGRMTVVLLHGNFASWRWWLPLLRDFSLEQYTFYAPELRGCGDTDHPESGYSVEQLAIDLYQFVKALKLSRFHLIGHSLGGAVSLQFALNYPHYLHRLFLIAPAPAEGMPQLKRTLFGIGAAELNHLVRSLDLSRPILKRAIKKMIPSLHQDSMMLNALVDDAVRMSPDALDGFVDSLSTWNVLEQCNQMNLSTLILWGEQDEIVPYDALVRMQEKMPHAELVVWADVGHAPQLERMDEFKQLLLTFTDYKPIIHATKKENYSPVKSRYLFLNWWRKMRLFWKKK